MKTSIMVLNCILSLAIPLHAQVGIAPDAVDLDNSFSAADTEKFRNPEKIHYPETYFHFIGSNISNEGIIADLDALKDAGITGMLWFHGSGTTWPKVSNNIKALTPEWEEMVKYLGKEAKKRELRLTVQTCPGWSMAGGPWINLEQSMRNLAWSSTCASGSSMDIILPKPQPSKEEWRDYHDICVLAFPTPIGSEHEEIKVTDIKTNEDIDWNGCLSEGKALQLKPQMEHQVEFSIPNGNIPRTMVLPDVQSLNHRTAYEPGIMVRLEAIDANGTTTSLLKTELPMSCWESANNLELSLPEHNSGQRYRLSIYNLHKMNLSFVRFLTAAHKNAWRSEAGWTLLGKVRAGEHIMHSDGAYLQENSILDISKSMDKQGHLIWKAPKAGNWTILRIGHINTGWVNAPAPPEATGWECNKLDKQGAATAFNGYVKKLVKGPLSGGLAEGFLMDSWECYTQTWSKDLEQEFQKANGYQLRKWMPAVMGYIVNNQETTSRFLLDWKRTLANLYIENFYHQMTDLAHLEGLDVRYETAGGDVLPTDIMEYFKYADVPMCEFWQPYGNEYVEDINFKPIYPTASAAHIYGKRRVSAECFTSFSLTWDEHWQMLKDIANFNMAQGVTHNVFHTYTHNPQIDFLPPGTSFGTNIGTPFLRNQTWWKYMPYFTTYLARTSYMLERGLPVKDVLWYLGDEIDHKPDQKTTFPQGYTFDYLNSDALIRLLYVKDGRLCLPGGMSYSMMWIPESERMLPETIEKIIELTQQGACILMQEKPKSPATLQGGKKTEKRFSIALKELWQDNNVGIHSLGRGFVAQNLTLAQALREFHVLPQIKYQNGNIMWQHRKADGADWYYLTAPLQGTFSGNISFRAEGQAQWWNPVTGKTYQLPVTKDGEWQTIHFDLCHAESGFVVFQKQPAGTAEPLPQFEKNKTVTLTHPWTLQFPEGWGAPFNITLNELKPWKDLDLGEEGKAFSGTATYSTTFTFNEEKIPSLVQLSLGKTDMIADVAVNGHQAGVLWTEPYSLDISPYIQKGENKLAIKITSTWYNRLAYDANQPEEMRKTWTINGPKKNSPLHDSGLIGPVMLRW